MYQGERVHVKGECVGWGWGVEGKGLWVVYMKVSEITGTRVCV